MSMQPVTPMYNSTKTIIIVVIVIVIVIFLFLWYQATTGKAPYETMASVQSVPTKPNQCTDKLM